MKVKRLAAFGGGGLVLVVLAAVTLLWLNLAGVIKFGVETGGEKILGVSTTLEDASVDLFGGSAGLDGLELGSPEGYTADHMFHLGHASMTADLWSLKGNEILVHEVVIDGAQITLEFSSGKTNWATLMDQLKKEPAEEEKKSEKTIAIERIRITNSTIRIAGLPLPLMDELTVPLPDLTIDDLRSDDGKGVQARRMLTAVIRSLFGSIVGAVKDQAEIPLEYLNQLTDELTSVLSDIGSVAEDAVDETGKAVEGAAEELENAGESILDTLDPTD